MDEPEKGNNNITDFIIRQLYSDVKIWIPNLYQKLRIPGKKLNAQRFKSPEELLDKLKTGLVKDGDFVSVECKPSLFGPFLRYHMLSFINGFNCDMQLGPVIESDDPDMEILIRSSSYLKPVGLFPSIDKEISQLTLYPSDATCCGFIGVMPEVRALVTSLPAIASQNKISLCGAPSIVIGIVRVVTPAMFQERGLPIELYESLRQAGDIWYLDVHSEGTEIKPAFDGVVTEMWGGVYASGHLEMTGEIQLKPLIEGVIDAFKNAGYEADVTQNQVGNREVSVLSRGLRFNITPSSGMYSLHMDAEIGINYKNSKRVFDDVCNNVLHLFLECAKKCDVTINNPLDLDFTYTDSAKSFTILESGAANIINDPTAMVVRDWHRKRIGK
ncbi:hypothetical protein KX721_20985 [Klebsiella quasipneumoniae]|uniref:hypothetical protein n=1 Tax=Klebsiella quasipneumoniae TaxID=1463165 RepID=UPI001CA43BE8|nr:hypothetical protein [Klebsiella quasipneumoniae]MBY8386388.1 hypothetical protein [Klebsiella quasipneumoniae]